MHATLAELLENLRPGLLWVSRDGVVRYANGAASHRTGLAPGRKLYDPDLSRAVSTTVAARTPRTVTAMGTAPQPGGAVPQLDCRVIPGLSADDAFVLIGAGAAGDHSDAFDNLMLVIRSDLHEPLAKARAALALGQERPAGAPAFEEVAGGLDELLQAVAKLIDLAALWGSSSLLATDRIEPWALLQQVWNEVEPLAVERGVRVRFRAQESPERLAALYGSTEWLKRVFGECLEAAVRASPRAATLEVEHRQMGPRALIVFRDCGAFARPGSLSMPDPTARPGKPRMAARDQIGLRLCQHIVSLHGGQLREEVEDGRRNFLIDLPTGAPFRSDHSQLDVAQAQRYASDLAELMARARERRRGDTP
jgi:hypothetical protein